MVGGSEFNEAVRLAGLTRAGCWSHARRYFVAAEETRPALALEAIALIAPVFAVEKRSDMANPELRARLRDIDTRVAIDAFFAWAERHVHGQRPRSAIGQALRYALNQREYLRACFEHPEIPIHNNTAELQLRRPVVGRKNWLFAGSEGGARSAAILFSITGSCRLHEIDPRESARTSRERRARQDQRSPRQPHLRDDPRQPGREPRDRRGVTARGAGASPVERRASCVER
jgi:hypothetical protein